MDADQARARKARQLQDGLEQRERDTRTARARIEVADYLLDCEAHPEVSRKYHPTGNGAVGMIFCRTKEDQEIVREALYAVRPDLRPKPKLVKGAASGKPKMSTEQDELGN